MGDTAIAVNNVTKRFRLYHEKNSTLKATLLKRRRARFEEFLALDDVSLEVPEGSTFALIGENGSGKSTLLKCMAKILRPNAGSLDIQGRVSALLELGAGFHLELSGRENIYLNGSILGLSKREIDRRLDEIIDFAGGEVPRFIDNPVKTYSSGMFVRLGFAIAINVSPDVLLIDEILAVGDEDFQRKCMTKFNDMRKMGRTVVVVSHGLEALRSLCDEGAWLEHGQVRALGKISTVVDAYLDQVAESREVMRSGPDAAQARGERRLQAVHLLDSERSATTSLRTGDPATIRIGLETESRGDTETLQLSVFGTDGTCYSKASTFDTGVVIQELNGHRVIDYEIPQVLLAPGEYDLYVSIIGADGRTHNEDLTKPLRFEVVPGSLLHSGGLLMLGGRWSLQPAFSSGDA